MTPDPARSYARITNDDLERLGRLADHEARTFFDRNPQLAPWRSQLRLVALGQGGADHFIRGERGVWDLDLLLFFAQHPIDKQRPFLRRSPRRWDWGPSKFGRCPYDRGYEGRAVDVMLWVIPDGPDPVEALVAWLDARHAKNRGRADVAHEPVVLIRPERGRVVWDPADVPPPRVKSEGHPPPGGTAPA